MSSSQLQDTQLEGEFWQTTSCCRSGDEVLMGTLDRDALWGLWGCPPARWGPNQDVQYPQQGHGAHVATSEYNQSRKPML